MQSELSKEESVSKAPPSSILQLCDHLVSQEFESENAVEIQAEVSEVAFDMRNMAQEAKTAKATKYQTNSVCRYSKWHDRQIRALVEFD